MALLYGFNKSRKKKMTTISPSGACALMVSKNRTAPEDKIGLVYVVSVAKGLYMYIGEMGVILYTSQKEHEYVNKTFSIILLLLDMHGKLNMFLHVSGAMPRKCF